MDNKAFRGAAALLQEAKHVLVPTLAPPSWMAQAFLGATLSPLRMRRTGLPVAAAHAPVLLRGLGVLRCYHARDVVVDAPDRTHVRQAAFDGRLPKSPGDQGSLPSIQTCRLSYAISMKLFFGAPQMGHLSGALPATVKPHTLQTNMGAAGRSLPPWSAFSAAL